MDSKYVIGVPEMDEQHAKLLDLTMKAQSVGHDELEMNNLVLELLNYANEHLDEEEAFLKQHGLSDFLVDHMKKHRMFRTRAIDFYSDFRATEEIDKKAKLVAEIGQFCEKWLLEHINVEDRRYAEILKAKGL